MIELDHLLVVAVHEINLDALDAESLVKWEGFVHLVSYQSPVQPDEDADVLRARVRDEPRQIYFGDRLRDVGLEVHPLAVAREMAVPARVNQHVLKPHRGRQVYVSLHRRVVHPGCERCPFNDLAGPPVPGSLAGPDPGSVADG